MVLAGGGTIRPSAKPAMGITHAPLRLRNLAQYYNQCNALDLGFPNKTLDSTRLREAFSRNRIFLTY
jgi:hypothetical protein